MYIYTYEIEPWEDREYVGYDALSRALILIEEAVQDEKQEETLYNYLIENAPTEEEKVIIATIRDDEIKHGRMFRSIYRDITGEEIIASEVEAIEPPESYIEGLADALFGELSNVEKYREIRKGLPTERYRDMLLDIITDEFKHGAKFNYLFTLNKTT